MNDLMDTSKQTKARTQSQDMGDIVENEWTLDATQYVGVKSKSGNVKNASNCCEEEELDDMDDTFMNDC